MLTLQQFSDILPSIETVNFIGHGNEIPAHFHITEIGYIQKIYIDCGGTRRQESFATMQIWVAGDTDHRLSSKKLQAILSMSTDLLPSFDLPLIVEYQGSTIEQYSLLWQGNAFVLIPMFTNCLAPDKCGISPEQLTSSPSKSSCGTGCC